MTEQGFFIDMKKNKTKEKFLKIPQFLYEDENLKVVEIYLLSRIDSLDNSTGGCFMSNLKLGEFIRRTEKTTANLISSLRKRGYLIDLNNNRNGVRSLRLLSRTNETFSPEVSRRNDEVSQKRENKFHSDGNEVSRKNEHSRLSELNPLVDKEGVDKKAPSSEEKKEENDSPLNSQKEKKEKKNLREKEKLSLTSGTEKTNSVLLREIMRREEPAFIFENDCLKDLTEISKYLKNCIIKERIAKEESDGVFNVIVESPEIVAKFEWMVANLNTGVREKYFSPSFIRNKFTSIWNECKQNEKSGGPEKARESRKPVYNNNDLSRFNEAYNSKEANNNF